VPDDSPLLHKVTGKTLGIGRNSRQHGLRVFDRMTGFFPRPLMVVACRVMRGAHVVPPQRHIDSTGPAVRRTAIPALIRALGIAPIAEDAPSFMRGCARQAIGDIHAG
jgi:hypothetical protein